MYLYRVRKINILLLQVELENKSINKDLRYPTSRKTRTVSKRLILSLIFLLISKTERDVLFSFKILGYIMFFYISLFSFQNCLALSQNLKEKNLPPFLV
jgi:hypothetical protein